MDYKELPETPGVYIFRNEKKKVIYVGKAVNLKHRVGSYFADKSTLSIKTRAMVEKINALEFVKTDNEVEALLLEADLIKKYHPPYNINLKDDKYYQYIKIEKNKLNGEIVLKLSTSRRKTDNNDIFLGPYPDGTSVFIILKTLRRIFPYRDCTNAKFARYKKAGKPCLYGHIGLCPAPCQGEKGIIDNNKNINTIKEYLKGDRKELFNRLRREMADYSKNQEYEKAAIIRDQIQSYEYLTQSVRDIKEYVEIPNLVDDNDNKSVQSLIEILSTNSQYRFEEKVEDFRIEIFDISNIQGTNPVGSMIVLTNGAIDKKNYRRFQIKTKNTPDDFLMMKEMLRRRYKNTDWPNPNLIVVDGGKGQLSSALEILNELNINFPIIGLAKRFETIIYYNDDKFSEIQLPSNSDAINLLKKGRDEAHRFAITYHRKLRKKEIFS